MIFPTTRITERARGNKLLRIALATLLATLVSCPLSHAQIPQLRSSSEIATAGYFQLSWGDTAGQQIQLQERRDSDNKPNTIYQGQDSASLISGLPDGTYHYRIRLLDNASKPASDWSEEVKVTVQHHPLQRALGFFAIGLLVFFLTIAAILRGARQQQQRD